MPPATRFPQELRRTAVEQWGLLTTGQLLEHLSERGLAALVATGTLERVQRGLYRLAGSTTSFRQRAMAEVLALGPLAAISHGSAARLWGFEEVGLGAIDVTVPPRKSGRRSGPVVVHRHRLTEGEVVCRHRMAVTTPVRTMADLATGPWDPRLLVRCLDHLLRARHVAAPDLVVGIEAMAGHPGRQALRHLAAGHLDGLDMTGRPADSGWEQEVRRWLRDVDLPPTKAQHPAVIGGRTLWIDIAMPDLLIAIEFDGYEHHSGRGAFDRDRRRWADLQLAGWLVIVVTSRHSKEEVVDRVRRAVAAREERRG